MNHDVAHCYDYEKDKCPMECFRARVTQDYRELQAAGKVDFLSTWVHFKGTKYCALNEEKHD